MYLFGKIKMTEIVRTNSVFIGMHTPDDENSDHETAH